MTADAITRERRVIDGRAQPLAGVMAGIAFRAGRHMVRPLARGDHIVVAAAAGADDLGMIHRRRRHRLPGNGTGLMAAIAQLAAANMVRRLTAGDDAVVTTETGADDLGMVHTARDHRQPLGRQLVMTQLAIVRGREMRWRLAAGAHAIMAQDATAGERRVVHGSAQPRGRDMAHITLLGGGQMGCRFATGGDVVMATVAHSHHLRMIYC